MRRAGSTGGHRTALPRTAALLAASLALGACSGGGSRATGVPATSGRATSGAATSAPATSSSPTAAASTPATSADASCAQRTLAALTDRQRIGQLLVVGVSKSSPAAGRAAAEAVAAGGYLLFGAGTMSAASARALTAPLSARLAAGSAGVRPFVAADQEGGQVQSLAGAGFGAIPSALVQGTWPASRLQAAATVWGRQLAAAGVNLDLAPVADVVPAALGDANAPIGHLDREYGHTAAQVTAPLAAVVTGLQAGGVAATAKHFPGLGRVRGNTDLVAGVSDPVTSGTDDDLRPFAAAIGAGARFVMLSTALYPRIDAVHRAAFSAAVVGLLRTRLGFTGLVVSDDLGAAVQVADVPVARRPVDFVAAGGQLVVVARPASAARAMAEGLAAAERGDAALRARVDAAALAVLAEKESLGLLRCT